MTTYNAFAEGDEVHNSYIFLVLAQLMLSSRFGNMIQWEVPDKSEGGEPGITLRQVPAVCDGKIGDSLQKLLSATSNMLWAVGAHADTEIEQLPAEEGVKYKFVVTVKDPPSHF